MPGRTETMSPLELKKLSSALDSLKTALELISAYKIENAKLVAALTVVSRMARTGSPAGDIAKFSEQALMLLGKK